MNAPTDHDRAVWATWVRSLLDCCRQGATRAALEEPAVAEYLDLGDDVRPVLVIDQQLQRVDCWFKLTEGRSLHVGSLDAEGEWRPAVLAPARRPDDERLH